MVTSRAAVVSKNQFRARPGELVRPLHNTRRHLSVDGESELIQFTATQKTHLHQFVSKLYIEDTPQLGLLQAG